MISSTIIKWQNALQNAVTLMNSYLTAIIKQAHIENTYHLPN